MVDFIFVFFLRACQLCGLYRFLTHALEVKMILNFATCTFLTLLILFNPICAFEVGEVEMHRLKTPRGMEVEVFYNKSLDKNLMTIIVAPGGSCNSKNLLFETLDKIGQNFNINLVRFEWAFCLTEPRGNASNGLVNEIEDMKTVNDFLVHDKMIDQSKIVFLGKSMGSLVAYTLFRDLKSVKSLSLLTPLCTENEDEAGNPLPTPIEVGPMYYPDLAKENRPVQIILGGRDPACQLPHLYSFLKNSNGNVGVAVLGGDHGFRIYNENGSLDNNRTQINIDTVSNVFYNWLF